jgi:hypothetical protein
MRSASQSLRVAAKHVDFPLFYHVRRGFATAIAICRRPPSSYNEAAISGQLSASSDR